MDELFLLEIKTKALEYRNKLHQEIMPLSQFEMVTALLDSYYDAVLARFISEANHKEQIDAFKKQINLLIKQIKTK